MFMALERLINLEEGYRRGFVVQGRQLVLMVWDSQPVLFENSCPHAGAPLHDATLSADGQLRCRRHGMTFQLPRGQALQSGCAGLRMLALAYDGDRIGIDVRS